MVAGGAAIRASEGLMPRGVRPARGLRESITRVIEITAQEGSAYAGAGLKGKEENILSFCFCAT
jgi:hypothetical protein